MNKKKIKIFSSVTPEAYNRLLSICKKYGFKSNYEIMQYLVHCFLRVADPENDEQIESVPYEIEEMFGNFSASEKHCEFVKPKRRMNHTSINEQK